MKKSIIIFLILLSTAVFFYSCKNESSGNKEEEKKEKVKNKGEINVENGKGEKVSISFTCLGCEENIKNLDMFNKVVNKATLLTKDMLYYPLSFIPSSIDLTVIKKDSLYFFDNNEKIENVIVVFADYKYIGKNSYGNELEGDVLHSFHLKDDVIDLYLKNEIKLDSLYFEGKYINRTLSAYGSSSEFISFTPTKDKSIIVKTSLNCLDEGASFEVILENEEKVSLTNWNDFNCEGVAYFNWFNKSQITKLKNSKIKYLYIYSDGESVLGRVEKNKSDYLQQLVDLY